jgi:hypothetical protein
MPATNRHEEVGRRGFLDHDALSAAADVSGYLITTATDGEVLDLIEAWFRAVSDALDDAEYEARRFQSLAGLADDMRPRCHHAFRTNVNEIFDLEDVGYQVIGTEIVDRESMVMHADVIRPVLSLLRGNERLSSVETADQDALKELKPVAWQPLVSWERLQQPLSVRVPSPTPRLRGARRRDVPYSTRLGRDLARA